MDLFERNALIIINNKRYYKFDLNTENPFLDHTIPYRFTYRNIEIYEATWKHLLLRIINEVDNINPLDTDTLLGIKKLWGGSDIFVKEPKRYYTEFKGIYLNTGMTATNTLLCIRTLLKAYGINISECELLIRRHHVSESEEIRTYFREKTISDFRDYLIEQGNVIKRVNTIINNFGYINKVLKNESSSFDDFYLFDDYNDFCSYKSSVFNKIQEINKGKDNVINAVRLSLKYLNDFYKNRDSFGTIDSLELSDEFKESLLSEANSLFDNLGTDVITVSKLYGTMWLLHPDLMRELQHFDNEKDFFKVCTLYLGKKLYFQEPYMSRDPNVIFSSAEIIKNYIYKHDNITIESINNYADMMHLNHVGSVLDLFLSCSNDYVIVSNNRIIKKDKFKFNESFINLIYNKIEYYIESFGNIDSNTFNGYDAFPNFGLKWNKYLLIGVINSFLKYCFKIEYTNRNFSNLSYTISLL